jgi:transcriptional regulator with XRE-family HTH domain
MPQEKNTEFVREFSQMIKVLRLARGLSQVELAQTLGITPGAICNWENEVNGPSRKHLRAIAEWQQVSLEHLLHNLVGDSASAGPGGSQPVKTDNLEVVGRLRKELKTTLKRAKGLVLKIEAMQSVLR